jgi:hypothetical protein
MPWRNGMGANPSDRSAATAHIDLGWRPEEYWEWPTAISPNIKGAVRRQLVSEAMQRRELEEVPTAAFADSLSDEARDLLGRIDPRFMGGEYLPDNSPQEVEIASIRLNSTTADVISVRARPKGKRIAYQIVDEYPDSWSYQIRPATSSRPLTLRQLIRLLDTAEMVSNSGGVLRSGLPQSFWWQGYRSFGSAQDGVDFATISSDYYPQLEDWYECEGELFCRTLDPDLDAE